MKDFSYLFYPGDVLRDTQFFSVCQKGAYLSVLCCHIENIRLSYDLLMLICKDLSEVEKAGFIKIFEQDDEGYFIQWVLTSIEKRRGFIDSRVKNRTSKPEKEIEYVNIISKTYVNHMENENENKKENIIKDEKKKKKDAVKIEKNELETAFEYFKEMRKASQKPLTKRAEEMIKTRLKELSGNDMDLAVKILNQSTMNNWASIYELKKEYNGKTVQETQENKIKNAAFSAIQNVLNK